MADFEWQRGGPEWAIRAADRIWRLKVDDPRPGLDWSDGPSSARLLGLLAISASGRRDDRAFDGASLVGCECHRGRVQATYAPPDWDGLSLRAAWEPTPARDGFDLEVQVSAASTGVFRHIEVAVGSRWTEALGASTEAGDPSTFPPYVRREPGGRYYVEMVRPTDCARRAIGPYATAPGPLSVRYDLFGHDLEKGVVLRGRVRGIWVASASPDEEIRRRHEEFLREPPALGP